MWQSFSKRAMCLISSDNIWMRLTPVRFIQIYNPIRGRVGTKSELTKEIEKDIAKLNRKTKGRLGIGELAHAYEEENRIKIPKSAMHHYCFLIGMYNVDSYLKPHLTIKQMVNRVKFALALLGGHNQSVCTFGDQNLTIDEDEKWFYVS